MADNKRIDEATGTPTVGHEWDGIEELDTPLPRWWVMVFGATVLFAAGYVVAYPALPDIAGATGWSSRGELEAAMAGERARKAPLMAALASASMDEIAATPRLRNEAVEGGRAAFKVHCVQCHGAGATGSTGYPNLQDDDWLWGGDAEAIRTTIAHGIRSSDEAARMSQMPAFGDMLTKAQIGSLVAHVRVISGQDKPSSASAAGRLLFADNCAACHGADGTGNREMGAPNLTDRIWLYGGDAESIRTTIARARYGVMPNWNARLDPVTIKMLATYVHSLGGGEAAPGATPVPAVAAAPADPQA